MTTDGSIVELASLDRGRSHAASFLADAETCAAIAAELGLRGLRKFRLEARLVALPGGGWQLTGRLGATVVQDCVVTLEPVRSRIETELSRRYLPDLPPPPDEPGVEVEMDPDTDTEPLPPRISLREIATEALALALPDFPRAPGAALDQASAAPPGVAPLRDEDTKPFAALARLRDKLGK